MGSTADALTRHIAEEREQLARDLEALQTKVRQEPETWFRQNATRVLGVAFGAFFLIGLMTGD
jgi:hypothetical protein